MKSDKTKYEIQAGISYFVCTINVHPLPFRCEINWLNQLMNKTTQPRCHVMDVCIIQLHHDPLKKL